MPEPPVVAGGATGHVSVWRYGAGVAITVLAVVSQYFVPQTFAPARPIYSNLGGDLLLVYGVPIMAFAGLVGSGPLRKWRSNLRTAAEEGLAWYGLLTLVALVAFVVLYILYLVIDPAALDSLSRTNPALKAAAGDPWLYVGLSFAIGALEEAIFRGWIFGYWDRSAGSWLVPATASSALFAGVHLYYGLTYGLAAPLVYPTLFFLGFAFAATYRRSGGNLVVPALLHGVNDATAFLTLVVGGTTVGLHYSVVVLGLVVALLLYLRTGWPRGVSPGTSNSA